MVDQSSKDDQNLGRNVAQVDSLNGSSYVNIPSQNLNKNDQMNTLSAGSTESLNVKHLVAINKPRLQSDEKLLTSPRQKFSDQN